MGGHFGSSLRDPYKDPYGDPKRRLFAIGRIRKFKSDRKLGQTTQIDPSASYLGVKTHFEHSKGSGSGKNGPKFDFFVKKFF